VFRAFRYGLCISLLMMLIIPPSATAQEQAGYVEVTKFMTAEQFRSAGLHKLTDEELGNLNAWFGELAVRLFTERTLGASRSGKREYPVEVSHDDELFIINGERFEARTYCFGVNEGDRVIFLEGSPYGACVSAEFLNLRTDKVCKVWCE